MTFCRLCCLSLQAFARPVSIQHNLSTAIPMSCKVETKRFFARVPKDSAIQGAESTRKVIITSEKDSDCTIRPDLERSIREYLSSLDEDARGSSPLAYENLGAAGRIDLVQQIADSGGYTYVSRKLGIPLDTGFLDNSRREQELQERFMFNKSDDDSGALALGAGREARIQSGLKDMPVLKAQSAVENDVPVSALSQDNAVPAMQDLSVVGKDATKVQDKSAPPGERIVMDARMRIGLLLLVMSTCVGWGTASAEVLSNEKVELFQSVSIALLLLHIALAPYVYFVLAPQVKRSAPLWTLKVLLCGPLGVVSMRKLGVNDADH